MEYMQMTLNDWLDIKQKLKQELLGVKQSFVRIGYMLRKVEEQKGYEQDGYKSIAEFANKELGLHPSTTTRLMQINREFSIDGYSERLKPEYLELNKGQLEAMLKLPDSDRQMIQPETPREDIRELNRFNKAEPAAGVADDIHELVEKFYKDNPEILNAVFSEPEFTEENIKQFAEIVNPGGNRSYKKGLFFLMMYENRVAVKKFGENPRNLTWWDFYKITTEIFADAAAGQKTWKNYFGGEDEETDRENAGTGADGENSAEKECGAEEGTMEDPGTDDESGTGEAENDSEREETGQQRPGIHETGSNHEPEEVQSQKEEIAPAQKSAESLEKAASSDAKKEAENEENSEVEEDEKEEPEIETAEKTEFEAMNQPEIMDKPFGSRKDYLDTLTEYGAAQYLAAEFKHHALSPTVLESPKKLEEWLLQEVDEKGREIEEEE